MMDPDVALAAAISSALTSVGVYFATVGGGTTKEKSTQDELRNLRTRVKRLEDAGKFVECTHLFLIGPNGATACSKCGVPA